MEWGLSSGPTFKMQENQSCSSERSMFFQRRGKILRVKLLTWLLALLRIMCALTTSRICVVNSFISSRGMILKATRLFLFFWNKEKKVNKARAHSNQLQVKTPWHFSWLYFAKMEKMYYILQIFNLRLIRIRLLMGEKTKARAQSCSMTCASLYNQAGYSLTANPMSSLSPPADATDGNYRQGSYSFPTILLVSY